MRGPQQDQGTPNGLTENNDFPPVCSMERVVSIPIAVEGTRHHMAGKNHKKVKIMEDMQAPKTAASNIARWPHPYDTAKQLVENPEAHVLVVQNKADKDQEVLDNFREVHSAEGEQGWWDKALPFSREVASPRQEANAASPPQSGERKKCKRSKSPPPCSAPCSAPSGKRVPKSVLGSAQHRVVAALLRGSK